MYIAVHSSLRITCLILQTVQSGTAISDLVDILTHYANRIVNLLMHSQISTAINFAQRKEYDKDRLEELLNHVGF